MAATVNPYLEGIFAPVSEEVTATELRVTGHIPEVLNGRYLRNGPNPVLAPDPETYHWFVGDGMVHGIRLHDGRAEWYRNRWVRAEHVAQELGEEVRPGLAPHGGMDAAPNTNVIGHAGRTFAIVEAGARPYELTDQLETIGPSDFGGTLERWLHGPPQARSRRAGSSMPSHTSGVGATRSKSRCSTLRRGCDRSRRSPVGGPVSLHDCAITERFVVLLDLPVTFSMEAVQSGARFPYRWQEDYQARVGLLPRDGDSPTSSGTTSSPVTCSTL